MSRVSSLRSRLASYSLRSRLASYGLRSRLASRVSRPHPVRLALLSLVACLAAPALVGSEIAYVYRGDATTPTETIVSSSGWNDGDLLMGAFGMTSTRERVVLLKDVTLGVNNTPVWGCTEYCPDVTFDLNGHSIAATGDYCTDGFGIRALCNLTFVDSVGTGKLSGKQVTCPKGVAVTFDLPLTTVVSSDTGYLGSYDPHDCGTKGSITINGGKFDGCVHGSDSAGTTLLTGGFFNKSKNTSITSYNKDTTRYFDNGDGYWRVVPIGYNPSTITVPAVENATATVYTNGTGSVWCAVPIIGSNKYEVELGSSVKVVYTAETDYVFAGGGTTYETAFVANEETITVTDVPDAPIHLSGVTVNGLDVSALYGTGWEVIEGWVGGYYTVALSETREFVLHGTNTGGYVRFDVKAEAAGSSLVVSNLFLSGYEENTRSGIYLDNTTSVNLTLKGLNAIYGGGNRPAIEVQNSATLAIGGDGSLAAFPGDGADPIGRYEPLSAGTIRYSGGRYNFEVPENQLADGCLQQSISETAGGYTFTCRVAPQTGVTVNGEDVGLGSGAGWTFSGGVLSLTNAQTYVLAGTNTTGAVRVEVTANANVTLDNFELICDSAKEDLICFYGLDATLTLSGTNTVYAKNDLAALQVANGAKLAVGGTGELVGGRSGSHCGRGIAIHYFGALNWNGGTLRDYYLFKSGSTEEKGAGVHAMAGSVINLRGGRLVGMYGYDGGAVYTDGGTVNVYGGDIAGNTAAFGAALYCRGTVNVYGGNITNNTVTGGGIVCAGSGTISVYGGVASGNGGAYLFYKDYGTGLLYGAVGTDLASATPASGKSVVPITDSLYAVGENVTAADGRLTGGTFTFNPTNAEYVAAGVVLADNREVVEQAGSPVTYQVRALLSTVVPQTVAHATPKVYTNEVEVAGQSGEYVVERGATVKVVYTAEAGYAFADGTATATAEFVADADVVEVPQDQLPDAPIFAAVRVAQASGEIVYAESFTNAMNIATNGATVTLLADLASEKLKTVYMGRSYTLDGNGHTLGLKPFGGLMAFAILSNDVVRMSNLTVDAQNATGLLAAVVSGSLTLTNCCVTGFLLPGGSVIASRDGAVSVLDSVFRGNDVGESSLLTIVSTTNATASSACELNGVTLTNNVCGIAVCSGNATADPLHHRFGAATIADNGDASALMTFDGIAVLPSDFVGDNAVTIGRRSALAFTNAAPDALDLLVPSAVSREGDILVTNLCGVALEASKVNVLNNGFTAWGEGGNIYLLSDTNFLYGAQVKVEGEGEQWKVYRSFAEAYASQPTPTPSTYTSISLVHYRNVPNGYDIAVQNDNLTVGAGTNLALRTVLRECVDGTNTTWNGATEERVTLTGTLTVAGTLRLENVAVSGKVVLSGGTLDIGADYSTNGAPVAVELSSEPKSEEVAVITSSVYTGAELLPHFSLKGDNLVFVIKENGLSVVKVEDKVARVGTVNYDTFSEAVTAVGNDGIVEIIASSNATTAAHRDEVKFGGDVQVADGKNFLVKSIRTTLEDAVVVVDENPTEPVTLALDGSKVTLGEGASMALTNVALSGTLELAGSGLLDFASFAGTMLVRPTRTGLIATNVTGSAQLRLGTGASGVLYAKGTGVWWRDGSFSAKFVQTGNGIGRIDIDDYGVKSSVPVNDPVKTGQYDYHYTGPSDQTGTDTNLSFGVVWCEVGTKEVSGARITLPPANLYALGEQYPQYLTANDGYADFELNSDGTWKSVPDLPTGETDPDTYHSQATLYIRNYGANNVAIATFNVVATEEDAQKGLTEAYNDNKDDELRDVLGTLEDICSDIAKLGVDVLFVGGILTGEFIGYTVSSWVDAVKGLISSLSRICADVYVHDGGTDSDYYSRSNFSKACNRAQDNGWSVHVMRSAKYAPCTLSGSKSLTIDAAACPNTDFSGLASCIIGELVPFDELTSAVISWASGVALDHIEGFVESQVNERVPHGMMSDDDGKALLTIPSGASVTLTGMDASGLSDKDLAMPVFDVAGSLTLKTADGLGKPNNNLSGFKSVSSEHGVVHVRSTGLVYLWDTVTANAGNAKNFYVEKGGLVLVEYSGKDSRVGISGQTGNGDVFSSTTRWTSGTTNDYAKIFSNDAKPENCTLGIDSSGNIFWCIAPTVFYLDLNNIPHYATYELAAADCAKAYVTRPNKDVEGVIGADAYNALFGVSVINDGTESTPYTLQVDLTPSVSNAVQTAVDAAMPSLAATVTNDVPSATVSSQAGLYYGIPGATEVGNIGAAVPSAWTLGTGAIGLEVKGAKPSGVTDRAFYRLRVVILPVLESE